MTGRYPAIQQLPQSYACRRSGLLEEYEGTVKDDAKVLEFHTNLCCYVYCCCQLLRHVCVCRKRERGQLSIYLSVCLSMCPASSSRKYSNVVLIELRRISRTCRGVGGKIAFQAAFVRWVFIVKLLLLRRLVERLGMLCSRLSGQEAALKPP